MGQGIFEGEDDYRARIAREADERVIEELSGSAPSRGIFESDADYQGRIATEASERRLEAASGSSPSRGIFEGEEAYRSRVATAALEEEIKSATGATPSRGWLESGESYQARVREEANEHLIAEATGSAPSRGWLEGEHAYRARIAAEAREQIVRGRGRVASKTSSAAESPSAHGEGAIAGSDHDRRESGAGVVAGRRRTSGWFPWVLLVVAVGAVYHGSHYLTSESPVASNRFTPTDPVPPAAPSFDCAKATWKSEKLVCSSAPLSALDVELSKAYREAAARSPAKAAELRSSQNVWIRKTRERCTDVPCLQNVYQERLLFLHGFES